MKRVMGLIVLAIMVVLPISVNAELSGKYSFNCTEDKVAHTMTCSINADVSGKSLTKFSGILTLGPAVSIKSITPNDTWTDESNGTNLNFSTSSGKIGTFKIATIVFDIKADSPDKDCTVSLMPCATEDGLYGCGSEIKVTEGYTCKVVDGKYYGKNGNEVTAEVYNAECVNNPQTGNFVPYVVIIAGIALAVGVFTISRKNTKLYKL